MNEPQPSPAAPDHLQDAKEAISRLAPTVYPIERQTVIAQEALAHAVIALVERLDGMTDVEPDKNIRCLRVYAPWGLEG